MSVFTERVDNFLRNLDSGDYPDDILLEAIKLNSDESLSQVIRLAKDDYGGGTYKWELKSTACIVTLYWQEKGIYELSRSIEESDPLATVKTIISFLAFVAAGRAESIPFLLRNFKSVKSLRLSTDKFKTDSIRLAAKTSLTKIVKEFEKEEKFPHSILSSLNTGMFVEEVQEQIFGAIMMRWFHLNPSSVEKYFDLINESSVTEPRCHKFLHSNPYLIDPFYVQIWSKPRFGEKFQPDFVIQSIDNSYTIIEIEDPKKPILTKSGNLSLYTTHAKRQALEYREWIISNQLYAEKNFPSIWRPNALVVIGLESKLTKQQKERLKQENESTEGKLRVVGFDWIYLRAKATFENLLRYGFDQRKPG